MTGDVLRLAAAAADRDERRRSGCEEDRPRIRLRRAGRGQARRHHPDRVGRAGGLRRRRVLGRPHGPRGDGRGRRARGRRCSIRSRRRPGRWRWSLAPGWAACSSTRRWGTRSRPTRSTRRPASIAAWSASGARASSSTAWTTRRCANGWGSYDFDDEGTPSQRTVLFDDGVLQGFLYDRLRAAKDGVAPTGNGRRESYAHPPIAAHDEHQHPERRARRRRTMSVVTDRGVYVTALGGGQVNPARATSSSASREGYLIEHGEVTHAGARGEPDRPRDRRHERGRRGRLDDFDTWEGVCGKDGQGAPVGSGSPTLRIAPHHGGRHRCLTCGRSCARRSGPPRTPSRWRPSPRRSAAPRSARFAARSRA